MLARALVVLALCRAGEADPSSIDGGRLSPEIHYTLEQHRWAITAEAVRLRRELERLESGGLEFGGDADLLQLEISAVRKELAHRESALVNLEECHAHACEFLRDAVEAQRPLGPTA